MLMLGRLVLLIGLLAALATPLATPPGGIPPRSDVSTSVPKGAPPFLGPDVAGRPGRSNLASASLAQLDFLPFVLTDACFDCTRPNASVLYTCKLVFDWFDPNSVRENNVTACTCTASWNWDGFATTRGADNTFDDTNFLICTNQYPSVFEMRVNAFSGPTDLTLSLSHYYQDSSLWGPPYVYPQTWAELVLNLSQKHSNADSLGYYDSGPTFANITGLTG